jgi:glycosyltransferase involved in cell wall biosynthesis
MRERLVRRGVPAHSIRIAENWADSRLVAPCATPATPPLVVLYPGNLGLPHDVDTVAAAMELFRDGHFVRFVFVGGGLRRGVLEKFCRERQIKSAAYLPYRDPSEMSRCFAACHVGLVTQDPATLGMLVPSKLYTILAAGRPVIFVGPKESTAARIIERFQCGWQIETGNSPGLIALLKVLIANPELAVAAGRRARSAFMDHYDRPIGTTRVLRIIEAAVSGNCCGYGEIEPDESGHCHAIDSKGEAV